MDLHRRVEKAIAEGDLPRVQHLYVCGARNPLLFRSLIESTVQNPKADCIIKWWLEDPQIIRTNIHGPTARFAEVILSSLIRHRVKVNYNKELLALAIYHCANNPEDLWPQFHEEFERERGGESIDPKRLIGLYYCWGISQSNIRSAKKLPFIYHCVRDLRVHPFVYKLTQRLLRKANNMVDGSICLALFEHCLIVDKEWSLISLLFDWGLELPEFWTEPGHARMSLSWIYKYHPDSEVQLQIILTEWSRNRQRLLEGYLLPDLSRVVMTYAHNVHESKVISNIPI